MDCYWYNVPVLSDNVILTSLYKCVLHGGQFERLGYPIRIGVSKNDGNNEVVYQTGDFINIIFSFPFVYMRGNDVTVAHSVSLAYNFIVQPENLHIMVTNERAYIRSFWSDNPTLISFDCVRPAAVLNEEEVVDWAKDGF